MSKSNCNKSRAHGNDGGGRKLGGRRQHRAPAGRKKLGKAASLPGPLMAEWLAYILAVGPTWLHVLLKICHMLCLRISEACKLCKSDFDFRRCVVRVKAMKRQPEVHKPLMPECMREIIHLKRRGISLKRTQLKGSRGQITWKDCWQWPVGNEGSGGLLFPSQRRDSKTAHRSKDTVCKAIARVRDGFVPKRALFTKPTSRLRSHSCRQTMINTMKANLVPDEVGMKYARIKSKVVYESYGELDACQAAALMKGNKRLRNSLAKTLKHK